MSKKKCFNGWLVTYYRIIEADPHYRPNVLSLRYLQDKAIWVHFAVAHYISSTPNQEKKIPKSIQSYLRKEGEDISIVSDIQIVCDLFDYSKYENYGGEYTHQTSTKPFTPVGSQPKPYELLLPVKVTSSYEGSEESIFFDRIPYMSIWRQVVEFEDYVRFPKLYYSFLWDRMSVIADYFLGTGVKYRDYNRYQIMKENPIELLNQLLCYFYEPSGKKKVKLVIDSALKKLTYQFFLRLTLELIKRKIIIKCNYCGFFAKYYRNKKYCSKNVDGRECSKKYHSRQDYYRHYNKRLPAKRNWIKKTREEIPGY